MIEKPDVDTLMAGPLGEWLRQQAVVRAEAKQKSNRRFMVAGVVLLPVIAVLWLAQMFGNWDEELRMFLSFAGLAGGGGWAYAPRAKAIKDTKRGINQAIAQALGLTYADSFTVGHGFELCKTYQMVPSYNRSSFDDLWSGDLGGRAFSLHEAHLEQRRSSGKSTHYVTVFRGAIMTIAFDRRFNGTTLVERNSKHRKLFGGQKDSISIGDQRLDCAAMVNPEFEDLFTVWTDDQVEARYLVHPRYIERLVEVERAFKGEKIRTLFKGGELVIAVESGDMFESGSLDPSDDRAKIETCVDQFMTLAGLCDALNEPART
jgi:hypothetical protein